jgi:hypothetical protein
MPLKISLPKSAKWGVIFPLAWASISRALTLLPRPNAEAVPSPLVFRAIPGGASIFSILWGIAGIGLLLILFGSHKVPIIRGKIVALRLDDFAILLNIALYATWGISYYIMFIESEVHGITSQANTSGRNYLPWAIAALTVWYIWFQDRADKVTQQLKNERDMPK